MRHRDLVDYCLGKPGAWLDSPWGEGDTVVKVGDKIFCFLGSAAAPGITVKNSRELVQEWRARYPQHVAPRATSASSCGTRCRWPARARRTRTRPTS
jgi:predicted DNA-binding protein (MmcQ/YjbR family)